MGAMRFFNSRTAWSFVLSSLLVVATFVVQKYRLVAMEESYIFLYDWDFISTTLAAPGGTAQLIASFLTQFMLFPNIGPLIVGLVYLGIILSLSAMRGPGASAMLACVLSFVPCVLLMLCIEKSAYKLQGHIAFLLSAFFLWVYTKVPSAMRIFSGVSLGMAAYFLAGSCALFMAAAMCAYDFVRHGIKGWPSILYIAVAALSAYAAYAIGAVATVKDAFTPKMYYDWNSTYFMMLYALCALVLAAGVLGAVRHKVGAWVSAVVLCAALLGATALYLSVHNRGNYENASMRYFARTNQFEKIVSMPYDGRPTPYTSYRFLGLAKCGMLSDRIAAYNPFIQYYFDNKPLVRKEDQQVLSDIYYACGYFPAARHSAFDTNIVTPGAFNPYETLKLAEINIVYANYAVADKLLALLKKTLFYRDEAVRLSAFLYNDEAVMADAVFSAKRKVLKASVDDYMSPKGTFRDLKRIADADPKQQVARQFYDAFLILTHQR